MAVDEQHIHASPFVFTTSQMKSLHYDQCWWWSFTYMYTRMRRHARNDMCIRCFIETKQNQPTSWLYRDIPVLSTTHLQAFKPKQASSDQPQWADQHGCYRSSSCISWNIFNRIHFFAICDVLLDATCAFGHVNEHVWSYRKLTKQLRTTLFPNHIEHVHTARQLPEYMQC